MAVEHEVKLRFGDVASARATITAAGGRLSTPRRLLDDQLFDTPDSSLRRSRTALRIRRDGERGIVTWKGPVQPGPVKSREEIETTVGDPATLQAIIEALGFRRVFRTQKFREEYDLDRAVVTIDDTPMGVFVEIETHAERIPAIAASMGCAPSDFVLDSYASLWRRWCDARGWGPRDMLVAPAGP